MVRGLVEESMSVEERRGWMVGAGGGGSGVRPRAELKYVVYLSYIILITFRIVFSSPICLKRSYEITPTYSHIRPCSTSCRIHAKPLV